MQYSPPSLEVADIIRQGEAAYRDAYAGAFTIEQERVLREIPGCRTRIFGGHQRQCDDCGHTTQHYNSCNNRHCPKCQAHLRKAWYEQQVENMLPVEYHHVVFTLPQPLADLAEHNPAVYQMLFAAVRKAICQTGAQWSGLRAEMGFTAVLHSWGERLNLHPHLHCLVPGGGVSLDDGRWVHLPPGFFLPEAQLRETFRETYLSLLEKAYHGAKLRLVGKLESLRWPVEFHEWIEKLRRVEWITFVQPLTSQGSSREALERTVKYLARYANRIAIANNRLISLEDGHVSFYYKDYKHDPEAGRGRRKVTNLPITEFIRRFLQHVLPNGMRHIRHYGFLSNNQRKKRLPEIREQLQADAPNGDESATETALVEDEAHEDESTYPCPQCGEGQMILVNVVDRPSIADILAIPWQQLHDDPLVQLEFT